MSAPSDGARADARKRLAAEVVAPDERIVAALSSALFPKHSCICEMYDNHRGPCGCDDELVADIATALAGVIADAKAEERERIAAAIEAEAAAGVHAYEEPVFVDAALIARRGGRDV